MSRLPEPGSDKGVWGDILNDYLLQAHDADGTLKANSVTADTIAANAVTAATIAPNAVTASAIANNAVTAATIANGSITVTELSPDVQASLANANAAVTGTAPDASSTTKGLIQLTGALGGTASAPTIASGVITDANISSSAAISQSKVSGLATSLSAKANTSALSTVATSGSYTDLTSKPALSTVATSGSYADLTNKPTIPTVPVTSVAGRTGDVVLTSTDVGLANVDNTTDANKPISTATQTALNLKATTSSLSTVATSGSYADLTNKPTIPTVPVTSVAGRTGDVVLTSTDVGLANVNNTSDANKPISTATQTALNLKASTSALSTVATSGSYADLTNKPTIPSVPVTSVAGRTGDVVLTSTDVGLANVNNTSDASKPISTATQTAINGLVPNTTTVNGYPLSSNVTLAKADVGLGNVQNQSLIVLGLSDPVPAGTPTGTVIIRLSS